MDELYDLKTDPYEMKNLIGQPRAGKALYEMKSELERLVKETSAFKVAQTASLRKADGRGQNCLAPASTQVAATPQLLP